MFDCEWTALTGNVEEMKDEEILALPFPTDNEVTTDDTDDDRMEYSVKAWKREFYVVSPFSERYYSGVCFRRSGTLGIHML
jgi:hypothetical protein